MNKHTRFLYYLSSVLCKTFKELLSSSLTRRFCAKADAKVQQKIKPAKLLAVFFHFSLKKVSGVDLHQHRNALSPYLLYKEILPYL
jgi:hypothetical protein